MAAPILPFSENCVFKIRATRAFDVDNITFDNRSPHKNDKDKVKYARRNEDLPKSI